MSTAIIGGGATGLAAGRDLARAGHQVTVFEAGDEIGGLAGSIATRGAPLERYYHHVFESDDAINGLVRELGLGDRLRFHSTATGVFHRGQSYDFTGPLDMLRFSPVSPLGRVRFGASSALLKVVSDGDRFAAQRALPWLRRWAGRSATAAIWEPLLRGKFGDRADEVSMAWLWARVHSRTFKLGYVDGGFHQVYERLAADIREHGGVIRTGDSLVGLDQVGDGPVEVTTTSGTHTFDQVLVTTPYPVLAAALGEQPDPRLTSTHYLGASCFVLRMDRSFMPYYWLNVNDPSFPFLAVVEHTNMVDRAEYGGEHLVYVGNYAERDDWRYTAEPADLLARYVPYLQKINPSFSMDQVIGWEYSKAPYAQPLVTPGYRDRMPPHQTRLPGVKLASMAQVYPYDRGQNYAIAMGRDLARQMA
jgi:protoporphyrinogen oxidase